MSPEATTTPIAVTATEPESKPTQGPTATPNSSETPPSVTAWPAGTRTGVALVDRVIELVEQQDWNGLAALAQWTSHPCEEQRPVQPQPLRCRDGMQVGDPITGFWVSDGEGGLWPPDRARLVKAFGESLAATQLHAAYAYAADEQQAAWLSAPRVYDVLFMATDAAGQPYYPNFELTEEGLVHFDFRFEMVPYASWIDSTAPGWLLARAP